MKHPNLYNDNIELDQSQLDEAGSWRGVSQSKKQQLRKDHDNMSDEELNRKIVARAGTYNTPKQTAADLEVHHLQSPGTYWNRIKSFHGVSESQFDVSEENLGNPIIDMIDSLMSGELHESNSLFYDLIQFKLNEKLELKKIEVAQSIIGESHDDDEDDNKSDEVGEDEERKHPFVQLNTIADAEPEIPLKYPEVTASGAPDQRSIRAATDRIKSGKSTSGIPKFKHLNGEESEISPEHAQHVVNILSSSTLKPDTKKQVMDAMYGSKAGFEKVKGLLLAAKPKEKSIYGQDARTA